VLPCLARALSTGDAGLRREICTVLYAMTYDHDRTVEDHFGLSQGLAAVAEDSATDPGTQMRCRYVRDRLRAPPREDEPTGEAR
jgi:hypothetical protein